MAICPIFEAFQILSLGQLEKACKMLTFLSLSRFPKHQDSTNHLPCMIPINEKSTHSPKRARATLLWLAGLAAGAIGLISLIQFVPVTATVAGQNPWRPTAGGRPLIIAHGGGQGLHPANTLPAFEHSAGTGCDAIEFDLRLTRDGVLVTLHDATIERTSDGTGRVIDFTLEELKKLNFGARFKDPSGQNPYQKTPAQLATLEELFKRFPALPMVIELKDRGADGEKAAAALADLIRRYRMEPRVMVASFDDPTLASFRRSSSNAVLTSSAVGETRNLVILTRLFLDPMASPASQGLQIPVQKYGYHLDFPRLIQAVHQRNMAVHYWTINDPAEMERLIRLGADGLITDRPDILRTTLKRLGYSL